MYGVRGLTTEPGIWYIIGDFLNYKWAMEFCEKALGAKPLEYSPGVYTKVTPSNTGLVKDIKFETFVIMHFAD
jgi:hypothetical protein